MTEDFNIRVNDTQEWADKADAIGELLNGCSIVEALGILEMTKHHILYLNDKDIEGE